MNKKRGDDGKKRRRVTASQKWILVSLREWMVFLLIVSVVSFAVIYLGRLSSISHNSWPSFAEEKHIRWKSSEPRRWKNLDEASSEIQRRIHRIMHPTDCSKAKKLFCKWNGRRCGFCCTIHRLTPCLSAAYKLQRTVFIETSQSFENAGGFENWFESLSNCKRSDFDINSAVDLHTKEAWRGYSQIREEVPLLSCRTLADDPRWPLPLYVFNHGVAPPDIVEGLRGLHANPDIWYTGQLAYYIIGRMTPRLRDLLQKTKQAIGYEHPLAAVHIRRGDKIGIEAHLVEETRYMEQVKVFFDTSYPNVTERRVFLATDDPDIKQNMHKRYPDYKFLSVDASNSSGLYLHQGYDTTGLADIIMDFFLVTEAEYTVCTFSSNVCRLQHELKQVIYNSFDASDRTMSVDLPFFYFKPFGQKLLLAVDDHLASARGEISFKKGDFIEDYFFKSNWKLLGRTVVYGKGVHLASRKEGKYPLNKVIDYPGTLNYSSYDDL